MRKMIKTNAMAQRLANTLRIANQFRTKIPNVPVFRVVNILANEGERIRKIAIGAMNPYQSMNIFMVESTWSMTGCEMLAVMIPATKPPRTKTSNHFSNQLLT